MQLSPVEVIELELTRLVRSGEHVHRRMQMTGAAPQQLERSAYRLLAHIVESGSVRLSTLADLAGVDISTVSRQVSQLAAQGLIARANDPADGRAALLKATVEGLSQLALTRAARSRFIRDVVDSWSAADRRDLGRLLAKFNDGVARSLPARQVTA